MRREREPHVRPPGEGTGLWVWSAPSSTRRTATSDRKEPVPSRGTRDAVDARTGRARRDVTGRAARPAPGRRSPGPVPPGHAGPSSPSTTVRSGSGRFRDGLPETTGALSVHEVAAVWTPSEVHPAPRHAHARRGREAVDRGHDREAAKPVDADRPKWPKAVGTLSDDRDELLRFSDYPAEHGVRPEASKPIDATFSTARARTRVTTCPGPRSACVHGLRGDRGRLRQLALGQRRPSRRAGACRPDVPKGGVGRERGASRSSPPDQRRGRSAGFDDSSVCSGRRVTAVLSPLRQASDGRGSASSCDHSHTGRGHCEARPPGAVSPLRPGVPGERDRS